MKSNIAVIISVLFLSFFLNACVDIDSDSSTSNSSTDSGNVDTAAQSVDRLSISAAGVKGPLAFADAKIFAFDPSFPELYDKNSPIASAISSQYADIEGLSVPRDIPPPYILTVGGDNAVDLDSGEAPVVSTLVTVIDLGMLSVDKPVYATPLTTLAFHMARHGSDSATDASDFSQQVRDAASEISRIFAIDQDTDINVLVSPVVINENTVTLAEQEEAVHHRAALEAFAAKVYELSLSLENVTADSIIDLLALDIESDGVIDDSADGKVIGGIDPAVLARDPMKLVIPNTGYRVEDIITLMEDERVLIGTDRDATFLKESIKLPANRARRDATEPVRAPADSLVTPEPVSTPDPGTVLQEAIVAPEPEITRDPVISPDPIEVVKEPVSTPSPVEVSQEPTSPARAILSDEHLDFPSQDVGAISGSVPLTLTNSGEAPMIISDISVSSDFIQSNNCNGYLVAGNSCTVDISFVPAESGNIRGTLRIRSNAENGPHVITLSGSSSDPSQSDSVAMPTRILDNDQFGTSSVGTWEISSGSNPYGGNSLYSSRSGDRYTFNVELDAPGEYQLFAWWTEYSNRRSSVPYDVKHLGGTDTVTVNQRQGGGQWNQLGTTWNFGTTATITLRSLGDGTTSADAIMLVPTGGEVDPVLLVAPADPVDSPIDRNSSDIVFFHDFNEEELHTYTAEDLRATWNNSSTGGLKPNAVNIVQDPDPSGSHGNVMRVFYAANSYGGRNNSGSQWKMKIGAHDELYLAYDVYFEDDAEFVKGGKLPGLQSVGVYSDPGVPPDGTDRWTGSLQWRTDGQIVNYMYHANQSRNYGDNVAWDDGPGGQVYFQRGKWHRLEIRYKMNTPGVLDGRVQAWLDGERVLDTNKIMYRMPGGEHLDIGTFTFITFYGGGNDTFAPSTDQHIYFDNFVISKQPITH